MPSRKRPPVATSRKAATSASSTGLCSGSKLTLVPSHKPSASAATRLSKLNCGKKWKPGVTWCSPAQIESNPSDRISRTCSKVSASRRAGSSPSGCCELREMPSFIDRLLGLTSSCLGELCQFGSDRIQRLAVAFHRLFRLAARHIERWGERVDLDEGQRPRQQAELERLGGDQA